MTEEERWAAIESIIPRQETTDVTIKLAMARYHCKQRAAFSIIQKLIESGQYDEVVVLNPDTGRMTLAARPKPLRATPASEIVKAAKNRKPKKVTK